MQSELVAEYAGLVVDAGLGIHAVRRKALDDEVAKRAVVAHSSLLGIAGVRNCSQEAKALLASRYSCEQCLTGTRCSERRDAKSAAGNWGSGLVP